MTAMAKEKPKPVESKPEPKRKRNVVFVSLDDETNARLQRFLDKQRIAPDRAAVAFAALIEFLDREEKRDK